MKHFKVQDPFLTLTKMSVAEAATEGLEPSADGLPLSRLRLAVKDLFDIAGLPTSAGNPTWLATHSIPKQTASSVVALLGAGATFCGKTITDELAYSLNGQNIHYGTPVNPLTPDRLPGGSSSGSAVAVASGLADIGLGTDTGGSIRVPASYNGLFGLRPTHGVIATDNMVALAASFDTVGWMTRDLATLEKVAVVLVNNSALEEDTFKSQSLPTATLKSFKNVLVAASLIERVAHHKLLKNQLQAWRQQGFLTNESPLVIDTEAWKTGETFRTLQGTEIWQEHGEWIQHVNGIHSNADVEKAPVFAPDIQARFEWSAGILAAEVQAAKQQRQRFSDWLEREIQDSVLIIPTTPGLAPLVNESAEALTAYRNQLLDITAIAGLAGLPQLHLPVCILEGAPCGLSLVGSKGSDLALIHFAKTLMQSA